MGSLVAARTALAQAPAAPGKKVPDELILMDGERLLGQFQRSNGESVVFKSVGLAVQDLAIAQRAAAAAGILEVS